MTTPTSDLVRLTAASLAATAVAARHTKAAATPYVKRSFLEGLDPTTRAALSGGLLGAGAGGLVGLGAHLTSGQPRKRPFANMLTGAALGAGLGGILGGA